MNPIPAFGQPAPKAKNLAQHAIYPKEYEKRMKRIKSDEEWQNFSGILGHYHVQTNKVDPGPGFDWEPFLAEVRRQLALRR